ncbi:Ldh family oxidoreductase [Palleronia sp. LCG004]|uniref:Ldh family oxidoreductase n=1 Tax=Palleronia sp. LCG004 TaxID=3079304 RepID=UPI002941C119|nr:Ldh family oxidoreductase [Palleronia sp. LCG004]WOI56757.1 Ldh family oxidoreductase [Palleronia sp. LCG004]
MVQISLSGEGGERQKLSARAHDAIRERIVYGEFELGRVLREAELSDALGMSKSPIREALVQLQNEGLVEMSANRSARVFTLEPGDITALGEMRALLEGQAIRLAVESDGDALARALAPLVQEGAEAAAAGNRELCSRIDQNFHQALFEACGNRYLMQTYQVLASRIQSLRARLARERDRVGKAVDDHRAVLEAVREGDADMAERILRRHIDDNTEAYIAWVGRPADETAPRRVALEEIERFTRAATAAIGAEDATAEAMIRALGHASLHGVDTHGYRLLPHYLEGLEKGRLNRHPDLRLIAGKGAVAVLDGGDAQGARATYEAVDRALDLARTHGIGAVAIRGSSHFGAAGAYATAIAEAGMVGLCVCNSDPFVRLHGGAERFHGTNPIAFAAPAGEGQPPWLLDMATSAIPFNKVQLSRALGIELPEGTASDRNGVDVTAPALSDMLAPLGAAFGYKGAGLAGVSEILSSALSDAPLSREIAPMISDDMATPRGLGAFVLALDPEAFMGRAAFEDVVHRYREGIRGSATAPGGTVMAAGDREWAEARRRRRAGITLDPTAVAALAAFAQRYDIVPLDHGPG